jgi:hypothetical protein
MSGSGRCRCTVDDPIDPLTGPIRSDGIRRGVLHICPLDPIPIYAHTRPPFFSNFPFRQFFFFFGRSSAKGPRSYRHWLVGVDVDTLMAD